MMIDSSAEKYYALKSKYLVKQFSMLKNKYLNDFQSYRDWCGQSETETAADFLSAPCIKLADATIRLCEDGQITDRRFAYLFIGVKGLLFQTSSSESFLPISPLSAIQYEQTTVSASSVFQLLGLILTFSNNESITIVGNNIPFNAVIEYINCRNNFIKDILNAAYIRSQQIYASLAKSGTLADSIANYCDTLPQSLFTTPTAYSRYHALVVDEFFFDYHHANHDNETADTSSIDFNELEKSTNYLCEYIEDAYNVPKWCSHTISFFLVRRETIHRMRQKVQSEYGFVYDGSDRSLFVLKCLKTGKLLPNDQTGRVALAWCITEPDITEFPYPDPFFENCNTVQSQIKLYQQDEKKAAFKDLLTRPRSSGSERTLQHRTTMNDVDLMTGVEFEKMLASLFQHMGFQVSLTKVSGDQGIDIIAEKDNIRIGIQAKCYGGSVGNSAVQEAAAGQAYYNLNKAMVITNNHFTPSAIALAQANNIVLWDRTILADKLMLLNN